MEGNIKRQEKSKVDCSFSNYNFSTKIGYKNTQNREQHLIAVKWPQKSKSFLNCKFSTKIVFDNTKNRRITFDCRKTISEA